MWWNKTKVESELSLWKHTGQLTHFIMPKGKKGKKGKKVRRTINGAEGGRLLSRSDGLALNALVNSRGGVGLCWGLGTWLGVRGGLISARRCKL